MRSPGSTPSPAEREYSYSWMSIPSHGEYPIIKYTEGKVSCQVKRKLKLFFASIETNHNIYRDTESGSGRKKAVRDWIMRLHRMIKKEKRNSKVASLKKEGT